MSKKAIKRVRQRRWPDWVDTLPGWTMRTRTEFDSGATPTDSFERGAFTQADYLSGKPRGLEVIQDENHIGALKDFKSFQFTGDIGGEFQLTRTGVISDLNLAQRLHRVVRTPFIKTQTYDYEGPVLAAYPGDKLLPSTGSLVDLAPKGTHAIAMVKPTNSVANLATDLAEIRRDGLPHLWGVNSWKDRTLSAKNAGDEYLNQEFGWAPLVSDVRGASYAAANAHKLLSAYERNSHKMVRRRYEFPLEESEVWTNFGQAGTRPFIPNTTASNIFASPNGATGGIVKCSKTFRKTWFSGAFTYHLPIGYNSRYKIIRAASRAGPLLGIKLTPDVVWQATPWSWALDWVSNIGDVESIMSDMSTDGLVIKYGYVMEHLLVTDTYYYVGDPGFWPGSFSGRPSPITAYFESKRRVRATPFGFEVNWNSFTPRQLAIAAALGISRWF